MLRVPKNALAALLCVLAALAVIWLVAMHTWLGHDLDSSVLLGFTGLHRPRISPFASTIANLGDPRPFTLFGLLLVAVALLRGRPRIALVVVAVLIGANVTTQVLKPLLAHARFTSGLPHQVSAASWPSGHSSAAMSLALCAVLVAPARLRPLLAALGAAFAIAVSYSLLTLDWHYPSDVLAGYLVAGAWMLGTIAALGYAALRWPARSGRTAIVRMRDSLVPPGGRVWPTLVPTAIGVLAALAIVGLAMLARPEQVIAYVQGHTVFVAGAFTIAALGMALATGLAATLRR